MLFGNSLDPICHFHRRIYVQFPKENVVKSARMPFDIGIPSRSSLAVYKAVKMRHLNHKLALHVLS